MVDPGSFVNVVYYRGFEKMGYKVENLVLFKKVIYGFTNTPTAFASTINLKVSLGAKETRINKIAQFIVVTLDSAYNALFVWPTIHGFKVVSSSLH